jgi:hypothetical protein
MVLHKLGYSKNFAMAVVKNMVKIITANKDSSFNS